MGASYIAKGEGLSLEPIEVSLRSGLEPVFGCAKKWKVNGGQWKDLKTMLACFLIGVRKYQLFFVFFFYEPLDINTASLLPSEHRLVISTLPLCHFHLFSLQSSPAVQPIRRGKQRDNGGIQSDNLCMAVGP